LEGASVSAICPPAHDLQNPDCSKAAWEIPRLTGTALVTLALCIGANPTIFSIVDAILIHALPFPDEDRLINIYYICPKLPSAKGGTSLTNYDERRGKIPAFSPLAEIGEGTLQWGRGIDGHRATRPRHARVLCHTLDGAAPLAPGLT
jgi:hypothetical protein